MDDPDDPDTPRSRAYRLLSDLGYYTDGDDKTAKVNELLEIFRGSRYLIFGVGTEIGVAEVPLFPLHRFIKCDVSLGAIKELCGLCPDLDKLLETSFPNHLRPIAFACWWSNNADVIEYLAKLKPELLGQIDPANPAGDTPLTKGLFWPADYSTYAPLPLATRKMLFNLYPYDANHWEPGEFLKLLSTRHECPLDALELIVEWICKSEPRLGALEIHSSITSDTRMTLSRVQPICQLLGAAVFEALVVKQQNWTAEAFVFFMNHLQGNTSVEKLELHLPPTPQQDMLPSFQGALEGNTHLRVIELKNDCTEATLDQVVAWLLDALKHNHTLERFQMNQVETGRNYFSYRYSRGKWEGGLDWICNNPWGEAHIKAVRAIVSQLDFQSIRLTWFSLERDMSPRQHKALRKDLEELFLALKTNSQLTSLHLDITSLFWITQKDGKVEKLLVDILENNNLTLTECSPWGKQVPEIQHILDLNRVGRATVRATDSRNTLVQLLELAWDAELPSNEELMVPPIEEVTLMNRQFSLVYGLLRENPALWCMGHGARE